VSFVVQRWLLAGVLLAGAFLRENTAYLLSPIVEMMPAGLYRIAGALWEIVLSTTIILLVIDWEHCLERLLIICACAVSISNAMMSAGCRIMLPPPPYPTDKTQCDFLTGLPISVTSVAIQFGAIFFVLWLWRKYES
jgi:hypothetical protein